MKLIFAVILWLTNKIIIIITLAALLTILLVTRDTFGVLGQNLWDQLSGKDAQEVVNKIHAEIKQLESTTTQQIKTDIYRKKYDIELRMIKECETEIPWYEFYQLDKRWQQEAACKALKEEQAVSQQLENEYLERKKQLGQKLTQLKESEQKLGGVWKLVDVKFQENWTYIFCIIFLILFASPLWKICCFFGIAPFARKAPPIQLTDPTTDGNIDYEDTKKTVSIKVDRFHPLCVRMDYMNQYDLNLAKRTRLFWKWSAPFISYVSGLTELTEFTTRSTVENGTVVLSPKKASDYITEIQLQQHPGIVLYPASIVGICGDIQVKTQWVWSLHSWLTGQHRYIVFHGTGKLYLEGSGGIFVMEASPATTSLESHLLIGFDSRLGYSTIRTETFWPYFRGKVSLMDNQFSGKGVFLRQAVATVKELTPLERNFQFLNNLTSTIGKFFGF